ncbi:MAG: 50S ribosomal protein L1 [Nitrospinota bacterium]|jgi:large subunit ribosomal protein L1|nr:50S ribosomal protein L1 [Nitrospinota bacterium]MDP6366984.1 50S ribosomal protein L1 [Nitrospinota bacterium]MDP7167297.1 50S ribosomal protein L1 [Nitrospinota bacterium]MDP7371755.1 50S ribosomal protein L1 [Nitrospinota bacterium]MDP7504856.1 50S ribosomal protein L1 [Nitrospinota bacterium]|tara:strand:+ start:614 stop:1318 length:705 start_codon:yes stop_codon:yes gene_type:complete
MAKHGKRYRGAEEKMDREKSYPLEEALALLKEGAKVKFDETVEVAAKLGVDPRHAEQMVRGSVVLPNGIGKSQTVAVFAKGDKAREAADAGADFVGAEDLAEKILGGWTGFDRAVATPDVMGVVGKIGRILGPRGLMPNPKSGTVSFDVERMVKEIKAGKVEYRVDKAGIIHAPVGKASFEAVALAENVKALVDSLNRAKPAASKGVYFRSLTISNTMGPGVKVDHQGIIASLK